MSSWTFGNQIAEVSDYVMAASTLDVFILADGFEDRAIEALARLTFSKSATCILLRYKNNVPGNRAVYERYLKIIHEKFSSGRIAQIDLSRDDIDAFSAAFRKALLALPREAHVFGFDISGCTSYAICLVLKLIREVRPFDKQTLFYTSAASYVPGYEEYQKLVQASADPQEIDYLPRSMALEMAENLVLQDFAGHRSRDGRSCLAVFAGYEIHRSSGVIDAINPALLLLLYGRPGEAALEWRLEFSKRLHRRFEKNRRSASEEVSTLDPREALDALEEYYRYLTDDYDLVISPICSKMHSVAAYLFWERYGEVQLTFPLPIGYNPDLAPAGVGATHSVVLNERRMLFRDVALIEASQVEKPQ